ncbi:MAG: dTMP kinase [Parvibaculum sp.]|nr:dTMP kinase [Parvibaculum sp.]
MTGQSEAKSMFLAVEGVDGSGKSGVIAHLADYLASAGLPVITTREPGGTPSGEKLRALLLSGSDDAWHPMSELLLMTAARVEHVQKIILPALRTGQIIISDRFVGSTIAYQGAGRGLSEKFIRHLHAEAVGDLWPDLTIVLDIDVTVGLSRSRRRLTTEILDEGRFESIDTTFHEKIRQSFLAQAAQAPDRHVVIDASGTPEDVRKSVIAAVSAFLPHRNQP